MGEIGKQFTTDDVRQLGLALIRVADQYPLRFLTERDFFPLVTSYLHGRVPGLAAEHAVEEGQIDFRIGGTNPSMLELVVAPRAFRDSNCEDIAFPHGGKAIHLYATQNRSELRKLAAVSQSRAKMRYLLLVDLVGAFTEDGLKKNYYGYCDRTELGPGVIRLVYVSRNLACDFSLPKRTRS